MVALVAFASLLTPSIADHRKPKWFENMLAGYALAFDEKHGQVSVYDPKSKFFLVRQIECDGADMTMVLTRDQKEVANMGVEAPVKGLHGSDTRGIDVLVKPLRNLATGKGVAIGDSPEQVAFRLGKPSKTERSGDRKQYLEFVYKWTDKYDGDPRTHEQTYTFRASKLVEIALNWSTDLGD